MTLMTQADFARHRGVGKSAVSNWKKAGLLVLAEDPADGRIKVDVARTDAKLNAKIDPMRGRPPAAAPAATPATEPVPSLPLEGPAVPSGPVDRSLADERRDAVREQRIGAALKNAQLAGDLVPLIEAVRRVEEAGRAARERVHSWFSGEAEKLAAARDVRAVMAIGEEGIDRVFAELADAAARGEFAEDDDELTPEEEAEMDAAGEAE